MKKFIRTLLYLTLLILSSEQTFAFDWPYDRVCQTFVIKTEVSAAFDEKDEDPYYTTPSGQFSAEISRVGGVKIAGCPDEIEHYEIRTPDGSLIIFSTDDEKEFTKQLFSMRGAYQVRFHTADWFYSGPATL